MFLSPLYSASILFSPHHSDWSLYLISNLLKIKKKIKIAHKLFDKILNHKTVVMMRNHLNSRLFKNFTRVYYSVSTSSEPSASLVFHFLKNSCALSQESALTISKQIHFKTTKAPHEVLSLLKSYDFSKLDIMKAVTRRPKLLLSNANKTVKPKFELLEYIGFSGPALIHLISSEPKLLRSSLQKRLLPNYQILKGVLWTDVNVRSAITSFPSLLEIDLDKALKPKIKILEEKGVSTDVMIKLLTKYSKYLIVRDKRIDDIFDIVERTGISPKNAMYAYAFGVLGGMKGDVWKAKVENFKRLGWTEEEVMAAFRKHPHCIALSTDKIIKNFEFYKETFGWSSDYVSRNSIILSFSFEKRILPRYGILSMLESEGLYTGNVVAGQLMLGEKEFLLKYVMKNYKQVPNLIDDNIRSRLEDLGLID